MPYVYCRRNVIQVPRVMLLKLKAVCSKVVGKAYSVYIVDIVPWFIDMCYRNVIKNINFLNQK